MATRSTRTDKGLGQNGLYQKLLRSIALKKREAGETKAVSKLKDELHVMFQCAFWHETPYPDFPDLRIPKGTSNMTVQEFHLYYTQCQEASIRLWGVSGMDEDEKEFDHGGK